MWVFLATELCRAGAPSPEASSAPLRGTVVDVKGGPVAGAEVLIEESGTPMARAVLTDETGEFVFPSVPAGTLTIRVARDGFQPARKAVEHSGRGEAPVTIVLQLQVNRSEVTVSGAGSRLEGATEVTKGLARLDDVTGVQINAAKKNEVIVPEDLDANLAVPAPRQAFAKIPGVNPWENDGSGVQLAVATRGLNPNWSWEFNVRLNGYDISADVFGYPEAYATPPLEMVERVELVRGAGALQYGTQFGGLLNFRMKQPPAGRRLHFETQKAGGAFGLFNTYNGIGGMHGRWAYAGAMHHRRAEGWRHNSRFDVTTGYGLTRVRLTERLSLAFELTSMNYTMQRPLGLTLEMFNADPRQSLRARNWMGLRWLVPAVRLQFNKDARTRFELQAFGLSGDRSYVGNIAPVANAAGLVLDVAGRPRQTDADEYRNGGFEARGLTSYTLFGRTSTVAYGYRLFNGRTARMRGPGSVGSDVNFGFYGPKVLDLRFGSLNHAVFAENLIRLTPRLSLTPGVRVDYIGTSAQGPPLLARREFNRAVPLLGVGAAYALTESAEIYASWTQNYRATHFNDLWRPDPTVVVDPDLRDVRGFTAESGVRGSARDWFHYDLGYFWIQYDDRIGTLVRAGQSLITNVGDSRNRGVEGYMEFDVLALLKAKHVGSLGLFSSAAAVDAIYTEGPVAGNRVEFAPRTNLRAGATYRKGNFSWTLGWTAVSAQFSNATNVWETIDGTQGVVPQYRVWDLAGTYRWSRYNIRAGLNNLADARYFTRRATGYPGPGIMPADARTFFVSFGLRL
jgi:Fe(3+) dicitrate transport protein